MKKLIAMALTLVMVAAAFAGCGSKKDDSTSKSADSSKATVSTVTEGKLIMGTNATFPPYEFVDDNNKVVGIDAEIAEKIASKLGLTLEIKDMEFDSLCPAVKAKSIDIAVAGMSVTDERKQSVDFTDSYATGIQSIIVKENSDIKSADDLKGKKIGVQSGTTGDSYCTDDFGQKNVKQFASGSLAVAALVNGQVDCVVIDNEPAKNYVQANKGLTVLKTAYTEEDYAIAVSKDNNDLLKKINTAMAELKADGTIKSIIDKYITSK